MRIKELSKEERPREKLLQKGPDALTNPELLAILLRTGSAGKNVIELSQELLKEFGGLKGLFSASKQELEAIKGIKEAKITSLLAVIELAKRHLKELSDVKNVIGKPADVYKLYSPEFIGLNRELFIALYLNSKNEIIKEEKLGSSTSNACLCHPQEFVRGLLKSGASRLVLIHNHPSNDKKASAQDIKFTAELSKNLAYFGFELLDHIIVAGDGFVSMKEDGHL
jgi:DNA repair protein RadC